LAYLSASPPLLMVFALLTRLARWFRKLFSRLHNPSPVVWVLDPDRLSEDLKDPLLRAAYIDFLEACLTMPASRYIR
jgi:hypothetical protein